MAHPFRPEQRSDLVKDFTGMLAACSIADLRAMVKLWGWPVKGTAKAALVEGIAARMCDPAVMSQAFAALPETERHVMAWISALPALQAIELPLAAVVTQSAGRMATETEIIAYVHDLYARGLLRLTQIGAFEVPMIHREWLPGIAPAGLLYTERVDAAPSPSSAALSLHIDNLLNLIETEKPTVSAPSQGSRSYDLREIVVGSGPVAPEVLRQWGYERAEEQHLARFLLTAMITAGLLKVNPYASSARLEPQADVIAAWQQIEPNDQQKLLLAAWIDQLASPHVIFPANLAWSEIELVLAFHLQQRTGIEVQRVSQYYGSLTPASRLISRTLLLVATTSSLLQADTWYSFERYCLTLRAFAPNLGGASTTGESLQFVSNKRVLDAGSIDPGTWLSTYGSLVAAWLIGPARWLGGVEVATRHGQVVAFRRREKTHAAQPVALPDDTLRFLSNGQIVLRTIWQAGELRDLVRQLASPLTRDRKTVTYRLDPAAYRAALHKGTTADQLIEAFADRGFPLPGGVQERLRLWETRNGRFRIYDNLAAIEFGDDLAQREVESAAGLVQRQAYAVSNRCTLLLEPESAAEIIEALQRRGYIPKVLP